MARGRLFYEAASQAMTMCWILSSVSTVKAGTARLGSRGMLR